MRMPRTILVLTLAATVAGCSDIGLRNLRAPGPGPDEFSVLPVKPLTQPKDYAFLPAPTPGGANLTDPNPKADAVVALGGSEAALNPNTAIPASDAALVTASSRYGVPANTRQVVAQEDADFRKKKQRFTRLRLFPVDRYSQAYRRESIDANNANEAARQRGIETPSAPPLE
ncbi:DUF3035 domain-containing protein [Ruegeria conchae]|uniref:Beta-barrel assembly complex subunit BamF n=1 Tax=Ruegeria conchae TaxID=981384 RepID=A0A497Z3E7_9RHOB|nr:DUF3035 domain-containing protein [Ruegeria conchae]RLJ99825.1 beta-barrel assembly complex subunit BamF [Ruegeria conchae]UWR02616.1 DUF3035 domain-containing protein [Ruegeria conchae]